MSSVFDFPFTSFLGNVPLVEIGLTDLQKTGGAACDSPACSQDVIYTNISELISVDPATITKIDFHLTNLLQ